MIIVASHFLAQIPIRKPHSQLVRVDETCTYDVDERVAWSWAALGRDLVDSDGRVEHCWVLICEYICKESILSILVNMHEVVDIWLVRMPMRISASRVSESLLVYQERSIVAAIHLLYLCLVLVLALSVEVIHLTRVISTLSVVLSKLPIDIKAPAEQIPRVCQGKRVAVTSRALDEIPALFFFEFYLLR